MAVLRTRLTAGLAALLVIAVAYHLWLRLVVARGVRLRDPFRPPALDPADLVNVFIGTAGGGHVFPGATLPHGMVKAGMDTDSPDNHAGYNADARARAHGFSQLHDDGTGGAPPLSNFKLWPLPACAGGSTHCPTSLRARATPRALNADGSPADTGSPGYFATALASGVRVELTAARRTALHRYTFPAAANATSGDDDALARILVDLTNDGQQSGYAAALILDPARARVAGGARFAASFGRGTYAAFVCADFRVVGAPLGPPVEFGTYADGKVSMGARELPVHVGGEQGALLAWPRSAEGDTVVVARVGVSLRSAEQACASAEAEAPDFDFERVRREARAAWSELLGRVRVQVDERDRETAVLFYSSLYRSHIVPADYSGENPLWLSNAPYYDSLYCNWDTYRTLFPLLSLHDPHTFARVVRAFVDVQQHEGWLPECRGATVQQYIQGGTSGDPILAEFFVKFKDHAAALGVGSDELYAALVQDAEVEGPSWDFAGRQAGTWKELGYLPVGEYPPGGMATRQVSRTLEYSFGDFAIAQVARALGHEDDARKYFNRSRGFELVWNNATAMPGVGGEGIIGFMQPRYRNGSFAYTDPRHCTVHDPTHSSCFLDGFNRDGFYEGGPIVYSQYVPHDTAKLIELQGGRDAFIRRLDFIFDNGYFDSTNEPSQQIPFMYHYADRPGLSTQRARQVLAQSYNTSVYGLPGNDDSGAMGSYVAVLLLGLYPLPATRQVLVSSPHFARVALHNPLFNTTTTIIAHGFAGNSPNGTVFVKSIRIDGRPWKSACFLEWDVFERGATVELELTDDRNVSCGADAGALPPSLSTGGYD